MLFLHSIIKVTVVLIAVGALRTVLKSLAKRRKNRKYKEESNPPYSSITEN